MAEKAEGTHLGYSRPRGGWPNTAKPEVKPGRKIRKARERLAARIASFNDTPKNLVGGYKKPGSLKVK